MEILKYLSVFFFSMLKFVPGVATGVAVGLKLWETILLSIGGMMSIVFVISLFGKPLRKWYFRKFSRKRKFNKKRRFLNLWKRYGEIGIAFLTPVLFTPILGAIIISSFAKSRVKIFGYMLASALFWALVFSFTFHLAYQKVF